MKLNVRSGRRSVRRGTLLLTALCSLTFLPNIGQAQVGTEGTTPNERAPTQSTPDERNPTQATTERMKEAQALYAPPAFVRREEHHRPHETYIGGFGGYTFGGSGFTNTQMFGQPTGGIALNDSGIYGLKIGHFLPDRLNWLGFEIEGFNTSPNMKPSTGPGGIPVPGASLRVTTVAFNAIIRGKFACGPSRNEPSRRTTTESHRTTTDVSVHEEDTFCPLQPYVGAGLGLFFAHTNGIGGANSSSDNAVPGFNGLAGVRYFFSEHVAMFGEYKYNRATFNFDMVNVAGGLRGDYSVHNIVGDCLSTFNANHITLNALIQRAEATDRKEQLVSKIKRVRGTSRPVETGSRKNARWKVAWSSRGALLRCGEGHCFVVLSHNRSEGGPR